MVVEEGDAPTRPDHAWAMLPRPFQWVMAFPHSPFWLGAAAGLGYLLASALTVTTGILEPLGWSDRSFWIDAGMMEVSYALWFAWVPVAAAYLIRGVERDAMDLSPVLDADGPALEALRREALSVGPRPLWAGAVVALLFTAGVAWIALAGLLDLEGAHTWAAATWTVTREIVIELAIFCTLGWGVGAALGLGRLTRERARLDLLDLGVLSPLARNGTRLAFFSLLMVAISLPGLLMPPHTFGPAVLKATVIHALALAGFGLALLLTPLQGARSAIRAAKAAEICRVRSQIEEARRSREDERLPGLLEWERRVASIPEWPVDTRSLGRLALYLLIPLGSWVGGALVERAVDTLLQ